jgi:hypothetical protein
LQAVDPFERHFTPKELAELWRLDESTVRRMFQDEPGVLKIGEIGRRTKRDYVTLRIPASTAARFYRQGWRNDKIRQHVDHLAPPRCAMPAPR